MRLVSSRFVRWTFVAGLITFGLYESGEARGQFVSPKVGMRASQMARRPKTGAVGNRRMNGAATYNRNGVNNTRQINHQLVSELRGTMALLQQADHDYNGHRAQAVHHLGMAVHSLNPGSGQANGMNRGQGTGTGNRVNGGAPARNNGQQRMPQAMSDQHLQQAQQRLNVIVNQISNVGSNTHHAQALGHVRQAAQHLQVALNTR